MAPEPFTKIDAISDEDSSDQLNEDQKLGQLYKLYKSIGDKSMMTMKVWWKLQKHDVDEVKATEPFTKIGGSLDESDSDQL